MKITTVGQAAALSKAKEKALAANKCMVEIKTILAGAGIEDYNVNTAWFSANV